MSERIEFAVFSGAPVAGWPADVRRLVRCGICSIDDLDHQEFEPDETSFVIEEHANPAMHAVSIMPRPHLVDLPKDIA